MRTIAFPIKAILLLFVLTMSVNCLAQNLDNLLNRANKLKAAYGELDERYLSALNDVVNAASQDKKWDVALKYRQKHTELTRKKFGENSVQYAEGVVRLANSINFSIPEGMPIPAQSTIPLYEKGIKLYKENSDTVCLMFYIATQRLAMYQEQLNDHRAANSWWNRSLGCVKKLATQDTSLENNTQLVYAYGSYLASCIRIGKFKDGKNKAFEAYQFIIENDLTYRLPPNGVSLIFWALSFFFEEEKDYTSKILCEEEYSVFVRNAYGSLSENYLDNLQSLALDYLRVGNWEKAITLQKEYTFSCRKKNEYIPLKLDTTFSSNLKHLYGFEVEALDKTNDPTIRELVFQNDSATISAIKGGVVIPQGTHYEIASRIASYYMAKGRIREYTAFRDEYERVSRETYSKDKSTYKIALGKKQDDNLLLTPREVLLSDLKEIGGDCEDYFRGIYMMQYYQSVADYDSMKIEIDRLRNMLYRVKDCFGNDTYLEQKAALNLCEGICLTQQMSPAAKEKIELAIDDYKGQNNLSPYLQLGMYYMSVEKDYSKAKDALMVYYNYLKSIGDTLSINYFSVYNNIGLCYLQLGDLYGSISLLEYAADKSRRIYGEVHPIYATTLQNMSIFYYHNTDYRKAYSYGKRAVDIFKYIYGEKNNQYAEALINLGALCASMPDNDNAVEYISKGIDIIRENSGENSPRLLMPYGLLIEQLALRQDWSTIKSINNKAIAVMNHSNLTNTEAGATYLLCFGHTLLINNNPESWQYFGAYCRTMDSLGYRLTDKYFQAYAYWTLSGFLQDKLPSPNRNVGFLVSLYQYQYWHNVSILNQKERESILSSKEYYLYKDLVFSLNKYDTTNIPLYDFILLNKGLLLATSVDYAKAIYESGDIALIKRYESLQADKKKNISTTAFSEETARIQNEEREIIFAASKLGASNYVSCNYDSIMSVIKDKDVAVEYVAYNDYNRLKEGIIEKRYAALVARKELEQPIYIPLCTSDDIEPLVNGNPNVLYNGDVSQAILNLLWKPIEKYVHKGDEVYFSPDGCIYKLALENIQVDENVTLGTKYNMHRCSSTRQIRDRQTERKYHNAVLYGGLSYDVDEETMRNNSRSYAPSMTRGYTPAFGETEANVRRGWNYLPGTKQEIDDVSAILRKKKIECDTYSGAEGNEESFKAMSGSNISILHIATHGFYIQESNAEKVKIMQQPQWMQNTSMIDKALRRSGLMMAGGNKAWEAGHGIEGIEDGVLTAQEISNLNLASVDLLVLSACETGLGDVANEGVFGLQWAFKSAGVGTIIMSLWEVDDNATALMMKIFYQELTKGRSKREAFEKAKKVVKETYVKPSQWAAFIMLD